MAEKGPRPVSEVYGTNVQNGGIIGEGRWMRCGRCNYGGPHVKIPVPDVTMYLCGSCRHQVKEGEQDG